MRNPIKFIQEVKQEAFKVTWPTAKETLQGALMVFVMAIKIHHLLLRVLQLQKMKKVWNAIMNILANVI